MRAARYVSLLALLSVSACVCCDVHAQEIRAVREAPVQPLHMPAEKTAAPVSSAAATVSGACLLESGTAPLNTDQVAVDVRTAQERAAVSIPSAMPLDLVGVSSNALVKSGRSVVLLGNGKDTDRLLRHCEQWRSEGLTNIRVLDGGVRAWQRAGGRVSGDTTAITQPLVLSPRDLLPIVRAGRSILLFADGKPSALLAQASARVMRKTMGKPTQLQAIARDMKPGAALVVFVADQAQAAQWRQASEGARVREPLFFIGDPARYDAWLRESANVAANANKPLPGFCGKI